MKKMIIAMVATGILGTQVYAEESKDPYFVSMALGYLSTDVSTHDITGDLLADKSYDERGTSISLELGKRFDTHYFVSVSYRHSYMEEYSLNDLYATFGYRFDHVLHPSIALQAGVSTLRWDKDPIDGTTVEDHTAASLLLGVRLGLEYYVSDDISLLTDYSYQKADYKTDVKPYPDVSEIEHDDLWVFEVGARYYF